MKEKTRNLKDVTDLLLNVLIKSYPNLVVRDASLCSRVSVLLYAGNHQPIPSVLHGSDHFRLSTLQMLARGVNLIKYVLNNSGVALMHVFKTKRI